MPKLLTLGEASVTKSGKLGTIWLTAMQKVKDKRKRREKMVQTRRKRSLWQRFLTRMIIKFLRKIRIIKGKRKMMFKILRVALLKATMRILQRKDNNW